ncbi:DUF3189 family protein [Halocella sp. SP3-1]|uniref:DUF3189 family protein n=1 Tax=Halocella sp. SP3-1 TaxID=2382161 RepID=UPI000F75004A|nr:DUF3189 family protein [Halocella sp. SP3-1]AZO95353.1 DUF3189 family protein [Halocella sp. SP3-1]
MIIIYHCYGGAHSSVLSAGIHTNRLPVDRVPSRKEILKLPYFDKTEGQEIGIPFYFGKDEYNNKVYIQGMGRAEKIVLNTLDSFLEEKKINKNLVYVQNTLKKVNILVRIGGFMSRGLGMVFPGRLLTVYGLQLAYPNFIELVRTVKEEISIAYKDKI